MPTSTSIVLPPLTPINTTKSFSSTPPTMPQLQRPSGCSNESPHHDGSSASSTMPRLLPIPNIGTDVPQPIKTIESKSIVGSVTSWLPHSSTIQVEQRNKENQPVQAPRPQYLEYLAGRKFLIIPKHNVVSISPTIGNKIQQRPLNLIENIEEGNGRNSNNTQEVLAPDEQKLLE